MGKGMIMILQIGNTFIMMMLAKFMLNDLPHSLGLAGTEANSESWRPVAWSRLLAFASSRSIPLREAVEADAGKGEVTIQALRNYRTVMAGYYLIAANSASTKVVNEVYRVIKRENDRDITRLYDIDGVNYTLQEAVKILRKEEGIPEDRTIAQVPTGVGYLPALERILWLHSFFKDGTRLDKVIAIDAAVHMVHDEGAYIVVVLGQGIRGGEIEELTPYVLEELFKGVD